MPSGAFILLTGRSQRELTCLEMERDVRKMEREDQFGPGPYTLPRVNPTINPQRGREPASSRRKGSGLAIY